MCQMCGKIENMNNCIDIWEKENQRHRLTHFLTIKNYLTKKDESTMKFAIWKYIFMAYKTIAIDNKLEPK